MESIDLGADYDAGIPDAQRDAYLLRLVSKRLGAPKPLSDVSWFHATRVPPGADFREGILPLGQVLDRVWDTVALASKDLGRSDDVQQTLGLAAGGCRYWIKVAGDRHQGPNAFLVREAAERAREWGSHDYFEIPEIYDDICDSLPGSAETLERLRELLRPCLMKFRSTRNTGAHLLGPALCYVYSTMRGERLSDLCGTCFDGQGIAVAAADIEKVEFLRNR